MKIVDIPKKMIKILKIIEIEVELHRIQMIVEVIIHEIEVIHMILEMMMYIIKNQNQVKSIRNLINILKKKK